MSIDTTAITIPAQPVPFQYPLWHVGQHLRDGTVIRAVAVGSSTTAGEGGIVPYPHRLEAALRGSLPGRWIDILNRGIGGEEAPVEAARLARDVIAENPCLVIWQVGTNAVWRVQDFGAIESALRDGLGELKQIDADLILMDLQYLPALLTPDKRPSAERMVGLIQHVADEAQVNVFKRFDLMRQWHEVEQISFDTLVDPNDVDRLHQSDASVRRMAVALRDLIMATVHREI